ncbi:MAG: DUF116 domain-containing protein [Gemmataceae bacterium]
MAAAPPPHCLKNAEGCPADYDEFGLDCRKCACLGGRLRRAAPRTWLSKVLVSEGTPIVLKIIVSGHVDAIVGVACLNVLRRRSTRSWPASPASSRAALVEQLQEYQRR